MTQTLTILRRMLSEASKRQTIAKQTADTEPLIDDITPDVREQFESQIEQVLDDLRPLMANGGVPTSAQITAIIDAAIADNAATWAAITTQADVAYALGAAAFVELTDGAAAVGISFDLANPRAVAYLRDELTKRIRDIDDVTKRIVDDLVRDAVRDGDSYTALAKKLRGVDGFDNQLFGRDKNGRDRADRVATFEVGDRYANGNREFALQVRDESGLPMEKRRLTAGDNRVRPAHVADSQDWIPVDDDYTDGTITSPSDAGCRCVDQYRLV